MIALRFRASTLLLLAALAVLSVAGPARATQHLVRPGDNWSQLQRRIKPGDEIILMPGRHRPATFTDLEGTTDQPITVRGLDPKNPSTIQGERYGIRLVRPRYVQIADLAITGATISGLALQGAAAGIDSDSAGHAQPYGNLTVSRVSISDLGHHGQRYGVRMEHLEGVRLTGCRIEVWGRSAIEIVGGEDIEVSECTLVGRPEYLRTSGIRVRAGCDRVTVDRCRLVDCGDQGVCLGGNSKLVEFAPPPPAGAEPGSLFEVSRVQVTRNVFQGSQCAVAFVNCERATVRNCTIVRPRRAVLSIRFEQTDPRFGGLKNCTFDGNLIAWEPGDLTSIAHLGPKANANTFFLGRNLWWSPDLAANLPKLGPFPGIEQFPQVTEVDPQLDENLLPGAEAALGMGAVGQ